MGVVFAQLLLVASNDETMDAMGDQRPCRNLSPEIDQTKRGRLDPIPEEVDDRPVIPSVHTRLPKKFKNFTISSMLDPECLSKITKCTMNETNIDSPLC